MSTTISRGRKLELSSSGIPIVTLVAGWLWFLAVPLAAEELTRVDTMYHAYFQLIPEWSFIIGGVVEKEVDEYAIVNGWLLSPSYCRDGLFLVKDIRRRHGVATSLCVDSTWRDVVFVGACTEDMVHERWV